MISEEGLKEMTEQTKYLKVLFVEDNEEIRVSIMEILSQFFDDITVCVNGQDGLEQYIKNKETKKAFDLILTDIAMPKLNGIEMSKKIRAINPFMPILF